MIGWSLFIFLVLIVFATRPKPKVGGKGVRPSRVKNPAISQTGKSIVIDAPRETPKIKNNLPALQDSLHQNLTAAQPHPATSTVPKEAPKPISDTRITVPPPVDQTIQHQAVNTLMGTLTNFVTQPPDPGAKPRVVISGFMKPKAEESLSLSEENVVAEKFSVPIPPGSGIPPWGHTYIYSRDELRSAKPDQKKFYEYYKKCFYAGVLIEVGENTNYGFILYFDLIHEYWTHLDLALLERQFGQLVNSCPKTQGYGQSFLIAKMREFGDEEGLTRLGYVEHWRTRYEKQLKLTKNEKKYYDGVYLSSNSFINIDQCGLETLRLYIKSFRLLKAQYQLAGTTVEDSFRLILDLIARNENRYHLNSPNYNYTIEQSNQVYLIILHYCENQLWEIYGHKRKINLVNDYKHQEVIDAINVHLINHLESQKLKLIQDVPAATEATVIALNAVNITRWKNYIELTEVYFKAVGKEAFFQQVDQLIVENKLNPSLETMFLELSKFLVSLDKSAALHYYLRYVRQNTQAQKLVLKPMSKLMQKAMFESDKQYLHFEAIVSELKQTLDLDTAIINMQTVFNPPRKKISLNSETILQVVAEHTETVAVLNEYLKDEEGEIPVAVILESNASKLMGHADISLYNREVIAGLNDNGLQLIEFFRSKNFKANKVDIEKYCRDIGVMKSALIDLVNEHFYELIDDALIDEQADGGCMISPEYFQLLINLPA
jgi:hypothetical protein